MAVPLDLAPREKVSTGCRGFSGPVPSTALDASSRYAGMLNKRRPAVKGVLYPRTKGKRTATQAFWYRSSPSRRAAVGVRSTPAGLSTSLPNSSSPLL
jgi:hypothetical protein